MEYSPIFCYIGDKGNKRMNKKPPVLHLAMALVVLVGLSEGAESQAAVLEANPRKSSPMTGE